MSIEDLWQGRLTDEVRDIVDLTEILDGDSVQVCPNCGQQYPFQSKHCPKCGSCGDCI